MEATIDFKDEPKHGLFAEFIMPKNIGDPVIVNRYLPDNTIEQIGSIYSDFSEDDAVVFTCIDRNGKALFASTHDYPVAEARFELYAKQLTVKAIETQRENKSQGFADRIQELKNIRDNRQQDKNKQINK